MPSIVHDTGGEAKVHSILDLEMVHLAWGSGRFLRQARASDRARCRSEHSANDLGYGWKTPSLCQCLSDHLGQFFDLDGLEQPTAQEGEPVYRYTVRSLVERVTGQQDHFYFQSLLLHRL